MFSWTVLIGRGLDLTEFETSSWQEDIAVFGFEGVIFRGVGKTACATSSVGRAADS